MQALLYHFQVHGFANLFLDTHTMKKICKVLIISKYTVNQLGAYLRTLKKKIYNFKYKVNIVLGHLC